MGYLQILFEYNISCERHCCFVLDRYENLQDFHASSTKRQVTLFLCIDSLFSTHNKVSVSMRMCKVKHFFQNKPNKNEETYRILHHFTFHSFHCCTPSCYFYPKPISVLMITTCIFEQMFFRFEGAMGFYCNRKLESDKEISLFIRSRFRKYDTKDIFCFLTDDAHF